MLLIPFGSKVPAIRNSDGSHSPHFKWTISLLTLRQLQIANRLGKDGVGIRGQIVGGLDCDSESPELAALVRRLAKGCLGVSADRGRPNSLRFLMPYGYKPGQPPIKKWKVKFKDRNGLEHGVEFIGDGGYWVAAGVHTSGVEYSYEGNIDPCIFGFENIPKIDKADSDAFRVTLIEEAKALGFEIASHSGTGGTGARKSIDDPSQWAPSPQHVLDLLKAWPNTPENVPTHEDFVCATAAIKTAFGPDREDYYPDFLEWAMEYPGNDEAYVHGRWASIR